MSLGMMFRWIFRELKNSQLFVFLFVLNLSLGLVGFIALDTFKVSLVQVLNQNSKNFLSADISISARRKISDQELVQVQGVLGSEAERSHLWEFFSMVNTQAGAKLVQVKGIEANYPFYGQMTLGSGRKIVGTSAASPDKEIFHEMAVWVYPELLLQLGLKVGDSLQLGEAHYKITDTIIDDSTQTFRLSSLAPKIYGSLAMIEKSGLVQKGTTYTDAYLFRLPEKMDGEVLAKTVFKKIDDPGVQVATAKEAGQESARGLVYLSDYLGLVSLVALFLSGIGTAYLYRSFFSRQLKSLAILKALGLNSNQARQVLIGQILMMGLIASLVSALVALGFFPLLRKFLAQVSPMEVPLNLNLRILLLASLMATLGSLSVSLPFLSQIGRLKGTQLFQEESVMAISWRLQDFLVLILPIGLFWVLSIWQANSFRVGSLFFGLLAGSLIVILFLNWVLFGVLGKVCRSAGWRLKHIGLQLSRKRGRTLSCALALSLGALLINLLPQLKATIKNDIAAPNSAVLPALFVFDIQEENAQGVADFLALKGYPNLKLSPMIRARILKVNGLNFEKVTEEGRLQTREEESEARFRNRGFNLTYRSELSSSEAIEAGKFWEHSFSNQQPGQTAEMAQISVEVRFAERLKFKLGDVLSFDVQGVEVQGKITSLRTVKWNSFQPNFFVIFQPGALDDAPKSFLVAIPKLPQGSGREGPANLQNELVNKYPNLSIVDVGRTVEHIVGLSEKMSWSLELMAALCLGVGFLVLYSIVSHQVRQSRWDLNLMKILGAGTSTILWSLSLEFGLIGLTSSILGAGLSVGFAAGLARQLFEAHLVVDFGLLGFSVFAITFLSVVLAWFSARRVALEKPQLILQS